MKSKSNSKAAASRPSAPSKRFGKLNAQERQINEDYEWCLHDLQVIKEYGGQVVVAHRRRILGAGKNHTEAWVAAQRDPACPGNDRVAFVAVPESPF